MRDTPKTVHGEVEDLSEPEEVDYGAWLYAASRFVEAKVGLGIDDLEDWGWHDSYEQEDSPAQAARDFLAYIGWPG